MLGAWKWFIRLFLVPFLGVGLWGMGLMIYRAVLPATSVTAPAVVTALNHTSDSDGDYYRATFSYAYQGNSYTGTDSVSPDAYARMSVGQQGQAEFLPEFPGFQPRLATPSGNTLTGSVAGIALFAVMWNAVMLIFVWTAFLWPGIYRRIFVEGVPAMATIVDRKTQSGEDSTEYLLIYRFSPADAYGREDSPLQGQTKVTKEEWDSVRVGQTFTVLYLLKRPRWNELYQFGLYRISE
jgi:hypothetical protein